MPTPKLTIAELLQKHLPATNGTYGFMQTQGKRFGVSAKKFGRWHRGESYPNCENTIMILDKMGFLRLPPEEKK